MKAEPIVLISAIEHFAYCPRQCALIHCDGVWKENFHTIRGSRVHRRVDSGEKKLERGRLVLRSIPLWSENLGLSGRSDAIELSSAKVTPVEYKSGVRHGKAADLQLCAQALCLEEMLKVEIVEGFVWYGGTRRRERVVFCSELRGETLEIIEEIRGQLRTGILPESANDERCTKCQLLNYCLPQLKDSHTRVVKFINEEVFNCDISTQST